MVIGIVIFPHVLIHLRLEVQPLCFLHVSVFRFRGVVVAAVLVLAMSMAIMAISKLDIDTLIINITLVFDLILILHGFRNLSLIRTVMARKWGPMEIRRF